MRRPKSYCSKQQLWEYAAFAAEPITKCRAADCAARGYLARRGAEYFVPFEPTFSCQR